LVLALVALVLTVAACSGVGASNSANPDAASLQVGSKVGMLAPDFALPDVRTGEIVRLSDYRGRPVLINFWATWCAPCRLEMPEFEAAYQAYRDEGFTVIAIDIKIDEGLPAVLAFIDELGLTFPVVRDVTGEVEIELYNVLGYPTSFFVDRNGIIRYVHRGPLTREFLEEKLKEIL
jgi:peroxiredoxin